MARVLEHLPFQAPVWRSATTHQPHVNVLVIVAKGDCPIYEADLTPPGKRTDTSHLNQFVIHTALDLVDEIVWTTQSMYLRQVDKFNELMVSAWVTAGHIRLMLLHTHRNEDAIGKFFRELNELYTKLLANPFYEINRPICSPSFDQKVRQAARRHLS
uniref:Trafficking protein particle complex subunit n=1 Tax=Chromera velia CCMP2878 TaxID=1169474 RepID=A0A0G4G5K2_9ALVE|mmetsp:Transcript_29016/g.56812  ORF Transcript_29016/g.56812 Transcript_29016/m.56812 type:complete len:158 (-) Transcript_29016:137-610(-)|eukprot:Cvel_20226.t1-p1 / transcript=Cvel_20226.t1 / gene=Cvel_20226 / organism=Chromera_velia_CCMP2878 / gene_product=Trafficking protein particle complex subunit 2, putative / transcript_product=Trafficking protein particle complex subunit 2, putative / location=Cvel_scaffold1801:26112-28979(-) / protein_length=157 / sequence_SO=supercontig / SO=protein_coding / is_pseudo=false